MCTVKYLRGLRLRCNIRTGGGESETLLFTSLLYHMTGMYILCLAVGSIMSEILFKTDPYVIIVQLLNVSSSPQSPCSSSPCKNEGTCVPSYKNGIYECLCKEGFTGEVCEKG